MKAKNLMVVEVGRNNDNGKRGVVGDVWEGKKLRAVERVVRLWKGIEAAGGGGGVAQWLEQKITS